MEPQVMDAAKKLSVFPAFHTVEGRRVVIVGGGDEAAAKVRLVGETSAAIVVYATAISDAVGVDLIAAGGSWIPRLPTEADFAGAALVFIATGAIGTDRAVCALARAAGVPVNVVDRPELCDFHTPALINRAPLAVAIGTAGTAPVLARQVRARIETVLAPALGDLARLADKLRDRVAAAIPTGEGRRRFWSRFFTGPVAQKVFAGRIAEAAAEAQAEIADPTGGRGHVSLVGAGPGAWDLLTLRAQRLLQEADVIVYDRLVPAETVAQGRRDAERIYVGKAKGHHALPQDEINAILVREAKAGRRVVRLKSGDPLIFGRAGEEMAALRAAGVSFDIVPGITAAFAAAAETEIPLTLRGVASSLVFASGHDVDGETLPGWTDLALSGATVAVYMGLSVAAKVAAQLHAAGLPPSTPVAVIDSASLPGARAYAGRLDELQALVGRSGIAGPVLILIGDVVAQGNLAAETASLSQLAA
ncbi:MAG: siroheme synthase CysG [Bauldia sp.]|nr:siroheme synthase CysG [Bauldia sp.]